VALGHPARSFFIPGVSHLHPHDDNFLAIWETATIAQTTLQAILTRPKPIFISPKEMAHIVGVVCLESTVALWGTFLSFNLQNALYAASRNAFSSTRARIYLSPISIATIHQLMETLLTPYHGRDRSHCMLIGISLMKF
jgi:hypothetical protein